MKNGLSQMELGFLLLIYANSGQLAPKQVSKENIKNLILMNLINKETIRKKEYYYTTPRGSQIASRINSVVELLKY